LHDPPVGLFFVGKRLPDLQSRVAIVGSRAATALGREIATDLGRALGEVGATVVSGAARGIDAASHRGALQAEGNTVAVLGSGIDRPYPRSSRELIEQIAQRGTVVSEYGPGLDAEPFRFPARNRLIAALARALVVVEGGVRSGSRSSVDHALDLGREVFAVPGPVTSPLAQTPLEMIRDGAALIRGSDDLINDLGFERRRLHPPTMELGDEERRVWEALTAPSLPDAVARSARLSVPEAMTVLMRLELRHLVRSVGGRYERRLQQI
jgi:DNA processing protein